MYTYGNDTNQHLTMWIVGVQSTGRAPSISNGTAFQHPKEKQIPNEIDRVTTCFLSQPATRSTGKNI